MAGRQFTWANSLPDPTYEKLDRVLMDISREDKYPVVSIRALEHIERLSDHALVLLTTGNSTPLCKHPFKFELGWLQRDGFQDMVQKVWKRPLAGNIPISRWNNKMRVLHKHLSGWASHTTFILKKEKLGLSAIIDELEAFSEVRPLSSMEIELKSQSNAQLAVLLREEELKWY
jgi:hypothetical protein